MEQPYLAQMLQDLQQVTFVAMYRSFLMLILELIFVRNHIRYYDNGKYLKLIPSARLREFNQWLRSLKLPGSSWRVADPGHLHHLVKKP